MTDWRDSPLFTGTARAAKPETAAPSLSFDFSEPLAERFRPRKLVDFAGLAGPRAVLAAFLRKPYSSAWLFTGEPGTGKTTMAQAMAAECGAEIHHVPAQKCDAATIDWLSQTCRYVPLAGGFHLIIIDEVDRATPAAQLSLLSKLDSADPLPNTIWVFTANATDRLESRFLSRCRVLEFAAPDGTAMSGLLARVWRESTGAEANGQVNRVMQRKPENVRSALMALEIAMLEASANCAWHVIGYLLE